MPVHEHRMDEDHTGVCSLCVLSGNANIRADWRCRICRYRLCATCLSHIFHASRGRRFAGCPHCNTAFSDNTSDSANAETVIEEVPETPPQANSRERTESPEVLSFAQRLYSEEDDQETERASVQQTVIQYRLLMGFNALGQPVFFAANENRYEPLRPSHITQDPDIFRRSPRFLLEQICRYKVDWRNI